MLMRKEEQKMPQSSARAGKMLVPLMGTLAALAMAVAVAAVVLRNQEVDRRIEKERQLSIAQGQNDELKTRLEQTQKAKVKTDEELAGLKKDLAKTQDDLAQATKAQETLAKSVQDREQEIGRITKDLEQFRTEKKGIEQQLSDMQTERDAIKQRLTDMEQAKGQLESKVMELSKGPTVELDKVVVTNGTDNSSETAKPLPVSASTATALNGQVVVVNREYDFVVMNLGKNQGLSVGQEFQIMRGNDVLGKVKVEKVYDQLSAAAILPESRKDSIREGDLVRAL